MTVRGHYEKFFLVTIIFFIVFFSLSNLTTRPKLWIDEGLNIEIARNFLLFQKLDISTAPGVFSGRPYVVGTNGYTLTLPLSGVFALFDFGLGQARIYMIFWLLATALSFYYLIKNIFNTNAAIATTALVATFGSFYGHGLTATGEIPGFFFLIWGLFFLLRASKNNYLLAGILFALAAVSKPSIFLLLFPTFFIYLLFMDRKSFFSKLFKFILGALPPLLIWVLLAFPGLFAISTWKSVFGFYLYPYGADYSIWSNIFENLVLIPTHTTFIYFGFLLALVVYWFLTDKELAVSKRDMVVFFFIYSVFALLYFLRSPGWVRYLIGFEMLAFAFIFPALGFIAIKLAKISRVGKYAAPVGIIVLLSVQLIQLSFFRSDLYSPYPQRVADYINSRLEEDLNYKVGIINSADIASLVHPLKRYHTIVVAPGMSPFGEHPLSLPDDSKPQFIAFKEQKKAIIEDYRGILENKYILINDLGGYSIYERK